MKQRQERLSELLKSEISEILLKKVKDPRISSFVTITEIKLSKDLRYARVFVSVFGDEKTKKETLIGLESAKGFIKSEIGKELRIRFIPELFFELDNSLEKGDRILKIMKDLKLDEEE